VRRRRKSNADRRQDFASASLESANGEDLDLATAMVATELPPQQVCVFTIDCLRNSGADGDLARKRSGTLQASSGLALVPRNPVCRLAALPSFSNGRRTRSPTMQARGSRHPSRPPVRLPSPVPMCRAKKIGQEWHRFDDLRVAVRKELLSGLPAFALSVLGVAPRSIDLLRVV